MSIPLVRNNTRDAINTSIIAIKKNLERINSLLGLADSSEPDLSGLATKQELEDAVTEINNTIDEVETSLQPVDTVTIGNMHSVSSNAVANGKIVSKGQTLIDYNKTLTSDNLYYTVTKKGLIKITFLKTGSGYTLYLDRNDVTQDRQSFYQGSNDYNYGVLECFVNVGDVIKIKSDGSYSNFFIQTVVLQELNFI